MVVRLKYASPVGGKYGRLGDFCKLVNKIVALNTRLCFVLCLVLPVPIKIRPESVNILGSS